MYIENHRIKMMKTKETKVKNLTPDNLQTSNNKDR